MINLTMYEEGVEIGIDKGQKILLVQLLNKKFGKISNQYFYKIQDLESNKILDIALNIFSLKTLSDLDNYLN